MDGLDTTNFLPPNWEQKYDHVKGKFFYVNLYTKATTFDDPRLKMFKLPAHLSSESIQLQQMHGSPYHVYPTANIKAQHAFDNPPSGVPSLSNSPQSNLRRQYQLEMSPVARSSPHTPKSTLQQETSFTQIDVEAIVLNLQKMFPCTHETRIRSLLKKYHNREAVVISALQVERHPLATPGPYTPPPATRHFKAATACVSAFTNMTPSRDRSSSPFDRSTSGASSSMMTMGTCAPSYGSPRFEGGFRMSPKPHSSPKMKLRYVKGLFPKAEETVILDILAMVENNVQKASERLTTMGYIKRDMVAANKLALKKKEDEREELERQILNSTKPIKIKSMDEKKKLKAHLQNQYKDIPEKIICMALESVDFSEDKAVQILNIVTQEDSKSQEDTHHPKVTDMGLSEDAGSTVEVPPPSIGMKASESNATTAIIGQTDSSSTPQSPSQLLCVPPMSSTSSSSITSSDSDGHNFKRSKAHNLKNSPSKLTEAEVIDAICEKEEVDNTRGGIENDLEKGNFSGFKTVQNVPRPRGANPNLRCGPNDELLLADYLTWNGANPDNVSSTRKLTAHGPDTSLLCERKQLARGANKELWKGSSRLAKGSMYSHDIICN